MQGTNPRAARIAALIQRVIASNMESTLHDKRLANVTITDVKVTNDLQLAKVYWTTLGQTGHEDGARKRAQEALNQAKGRLRTLVGRKAGLRLTPQLQFIFDKVPGEAHEIDDIIMLARKRDEELARMRSTAQYAGDADPYRREEQDEPEPAVEAMEASDGIAAGDKPYERMEHGTQPDIMDRADINADRDEYDEYDGDVVEVEEFEDSDDINLDEPEAL
ncbi:30S ribosome-binding factor RbfA [Bifidobacterium gallicum]|uniref:Ribosome-binding factor A n=1 Tax=Bifidobacterium gallicum DSM 20093 = LMG 11596 TaxID=561180 RepID=D1NVA0_9BIFI|nr:30S ribosome-binding factor RbfA [Bifidobacterium gallicum]EFA22751.1 ribosome-binding factor A [Bifidobacterium gallicum DSM 20093 = LMG 11596]KFI59695.1 ribosome-binding factor A [Bifidobacterium gallicum DSM 20093 = LMG 11596]